MMIRTPKGLIGLPVGYIEEDPDRFLIYFPDEIKSRVKNPKIAHEVIKEVFNRNKNLKNLLSSMTSRDYEALENRLVTWKHKHQAYKDMTSSKIYERNKAMEEKSKELKENKDNKENE